MLSTGLFLLYAIVAVIVLQLLSFARLSTLQSWVVVAVTAGAGATAFYFLNPGNDGFEATRLTKRAEYAAHALATVAPDKTILLFIGGSRTHFGLRRVKLEATLAAHKIKAAAIKLTVPGADHFQRLEMLRQFTRKVREAGTPMSQNFIALFEIQENYDTRPLTFWRVMNQAWSPEALQSAQIHNADVVLKSYLSSRQSYDLKTLVQFIGHLGANATGLGQLAPQIAKAKRTSEVGLREDPALDEQRPGGARRVRRAIKRFEEKLENIEAEPAAETNGWRNKFVAPLQLAALPRAPTAVIFFNVPSIKPADYRHARNSCATFSPDPCFYFGLNQWRDNPSFFEGGNWRDPGHMLEPLAEDWSEYFALELASPDGPIKGLAK